MYGRRLIPLRAQVRPEMAKAFQELAPAADKPQFVSTLGPCGAHGPFLLKPKGMIKMAKAKATVRLPLLEGENEILEVGVNGKMYLLRRGEELSVSQEVYEVLSNAGLTGGDRDEP